MNAPEKIFVWSGGNSFKLAQKGDTLTTDLNEAARQRQQIKEDTETWERQRAEEQDLRDALKKRFS